MATLAARNVVQSHTYGRQAMRINTKMMIQALQASVLNARSRLIPGVAIRNSIRGRTPDQNSMAKKIPTNTRALPRSGCLSTMRNGTPTISAGPIRSLRERGGFFPAGQKPGQHEHGGHLGQLGGLADLMSADGEPAVATLGGAGTGADHQHQAQQQDAEGVQRGGHPLEHPERDVVDHPAGHDAHAEPDELALPHAGRPGGHIGLARRVERGQAKRA